MPPTVTLTITTGKLSGKQYGSAENHPVPIRQRDNSIPEKLAEVIDLALTEKPQIYFQNAIEFKEALLKSS